MELDNVPLPGEDDALDYYSGREFSPSLEILLCPVSSVTVLACARGRFTSGAGGFEL